MIKSDNRPPTSRLLFRIAKGETADRMYVERERERLLPAVKYFFVIAILFSSFSQRKITRGRGKESGGPKEGGANTRERIFFARYYSRRE